MENVLIVATATTILQYDRPAGWVPTAERNQYCPGGLIETTDLRQYQYRQYRLRVTEDRESMTEGFILHITSTDVKVEIMTHF